MALLKNRFQIVHYGICNDDFVGCEDVEIENFLNTNPSFREYIRKIYKFSSEGSEPVTYPVQTKDKYDNLRTLFNVKEGDLLDDRITRAIKFFNCGQQYIIECKNDIDLLEDGIEIPGFANVVQPEIPIEKTGLITNDCCLTEDQFPTPFTDRIQFAWYGICTECSNVRVEDVLNKNNLYRENISKIFKYTSEGSEPTSYRVQSPDKYNNLRKLYNISEGEYLDDRIGTLGFKEFECGSAYIFVCKNQIELIEKGILISGFTVNSPSARVGNCNIVEQSSLKLIKDCADKSYEVVISNYNEPNQSTLPCRDVAILLTNNKPSETENWKDISNYTHIHYTNLCTLPNTPTKFIELCGDTNKPNGDIPSESELITCVTPTPTSNETRGDTTPTETIDIPLEELQTPSAEQRDITPTPTSNETRGDTTPTETIDIPLEELQTPSAEQRDITPTSTESHTGTTPTITWKPDGTFTITPPNYFPVIVDISSPCEGRNEWGKHEDLVDECITPTPTVSFNEPPPTLTFTNTISETQTNTISETQTNTISETQTNTIIETPTTTNTICPWFDCEGVCEGSAETDCAGVCNGDAKLDCLGVCNGIAVLDCEGVCNGNAVVDCAGVCNGNARLDCADICNGNTQFDCLGVCGGNAVIDVCGECDGGETNPDNCDCVKDCAGVCNGDAKLDCEGVCNGDAKLDCAGICNGNTQIDCAGVCGGNAKRDCAGICNGNTQIDCAGVCGGNSKLDCAGICNGDSVEDCLGICNGNTQIDCNGICDGDGRLDCAGICNGDTKVDCEGVCDGDAVIDCAGICNGNTKIDCEGVCDGDAKLDCAGICNGDTKFDCLGICGGNAKIDVCGKCNGGETNPDNCDCIKDCAGVCNGTAKLDCLGICNGNAKLDCNNVCGGNDFFDCEGVCGGNAKLDCEGVCNGDAKLDCEGVCNGDAKLDCEGVCNGPAKVDCKGKCNGNAKLDCKNICGGDAKLDCKGDCDGNAILDCEGVCGGNAIIDCEGVCNGDAIRDCAGICNGNSRRDCAGVCNGNCKRDVCGVCCGNNQNPDDCCVNCEESFGQMEFFNHGFGWQGTGSEELRMRVRERSAPVWEIGDNTYRIYGDLAVPVRQPLPIYDLARYRKDERNNPRRGKITLATSLETDRCDPMGGRATDSKHIRFLDNDAIKIDNESSLITIQTGIISDNVEKIQGTSTYRHTFRLRESDIDIRDGDNVYIRSIRGSFAGTYERAVVTSAGGGEWSIVSKKYSDKRPFFAPGRNQTVLFVLNRIAVPTAGGGNANYCDRGDMLLGGESDVFKYKVGENLELTNRMGNTTNASITEIDEAKGTITFNNILRGHIQWWSFDAEDGGVGGIARTDVEQQNPTVFDEFPSVKNLTTPCMIRLESRTNIPAEWEEQVGPFGTLLVFDGRLNGKTWTIHRINSLSRTLFYVKSESTGSDENMLCNECSCAFRIRNLGAGDPPNIGPRSVCAVAGGRIRTHATSMFEYDGINPQLENDKLAVKAKEGGVSYVPYMTGYLAMGNPAHPDLIELVKSQRFDYIEFEAGDFEA